MADGLEESNETTPSSSESASEGYQIDSPRYQAEEEDVAPKAEHDIVRRILEHAEGLEWDEFGLPKQRRRGAELEPRGGWMPDEALGATVTGTDGLERQRRDWQVNIRLDRERYAALRSAATVYGTTPTALARMLVNRGAEAVLNAHRAEMAAREWPDPEG